MPTIHSLSFQLSAIIVLFFCHTIYSQDISVSNIAGNGTSAFEPDNLALETGFGVPSSLAKDSHGNIYFGVASIGDSDLSGIYKIDNETKILVKILSNVPSISGITIDGADNIYYSRGAALDDGEFPERKEYIYFINSTTGLVDTLAGNGEDGFPVNGADARSTPIGNAGGLKIDPSGQYLYYSAALGGKNFIQKINLNTKITTRVAGVGGLDPLIDVEDGTPALDAELHLGIGLGWDSKGNLYFGTLDYQIKKLKGSNNKIYHLVGTGEAGYNGDDIRADTAQLGSSNSGFTIRDDKLYFCDTGNNRIREITLLPPDGPFPMISSYCGTGFEEGDESNPTGDLDNGETKLALQTNVQPVDILLVGNLFVFSDMGVNRIRTISECQEPIITVTEISASQICKGDQVTLSVSGELGGGDDWNWFEGSCGIDAISIGSGISLDIVANQSTSYYVAASGGCLLDPLCEEIILEVGCKEYFNTFSPNGDGKNEFFEIPVLDNYTNNTVVIYNRWGQIILTINDYDNLMNVWNGTYSNTVGSEVVDAGTYYFTAESNGELISSGWIQIVK